jgi:hypothetical protein
LPFRRAKDKASDWLENGGSSVIGAAKVTAQVFSRLLGGQGTSAFQFHFDGEFACVPYGQNAHVACRNRIQQASQPLTGVCWHGKENHVVPPLMVPFGVVVGDVILQGLAPSNLAFRYGWLASLDATSKSEES